MLRIPAQVPAHMIVIADQINAGNYAAALPLVDTALAAAPGDEFLNIVKLSTLENLGDTAAMGEQLKRMVEAFPDNESFWQALVRWHMSQGDPDGAEAVLRELAAKSPDDPEANYRVVQLLLQSKGPDAARAELQRLVDTGKNNLAYRRALAVLDFSAGDTEGGIAEMHRLIDTSEPSDDRRDTQAALAQMLGQTGDTAGRDALVDTILAEDASHVEALKLRARREIDADQPELAVQDMRTALEQSPRDPDILTLMAEAHEREGARELAGERLALAVEVSDKRPAESIRYARFLMQDDRVGPAESVVVDALKVNPNNRDLLLLLGQIHLQRRDWERALQVADLLRKQNDPAATRMADGIEATALRSQDKLDETVKMLRGLVEENDQDTRALAGLVQTYVEAGEIDTAQTYVKEQLDKNPTSIPLRMMQAGLYTVGDDTAAAEKLYREIIAEQPAYAQPYRTLFALLNFQGKRDAAEAVLDQGIAAAPEDGGLLFTKASLLEQHEDFDGAIALYETLYARDSSSDSRRQQPREPAHHDPHRSREPRPRLRHRPPSARLGRALLSGHLRLDPDPARRSRAGADLPRARREEPARQRPGADPPRHDLCRPRTLGRRQRGARPRTRPGRTRQHPARGRHRARQARRDRQPLGGRGARSDRPRQLGRVSIRTGTDPPLVHTVCKISSR